LEYAILAISVSIFFHGIIVLWNSYSLNMALYRIMNAAIHAISIEKIQVMQLEKGEIIEEIIKN